MPVEVHMVWGLPSSTHISLFILESHLAPAALTFLVFQTVKFYFLLGVLLLLFPSPGSLFFQVFAMAASIFEMAASTSLSQLQIRLHWPPSYTPASLLPATRCLNSLLYFFTAFSNVWNDLSHVLAYVLTLRLLSLECKLHGDADFLFSTLIFPVPILH